MYYLDNDRNECNRDLCSITDIFKVERCPEQNDDQLAQNICSILIPMLEAREAVIEKEAGLAKSDHHVRGNCDT